MEKNLKLAIGIDGKTGVLFHRDDFLPGIALGITAMKRMGPYFAAETGLEGGYFPSVKKGELGAGPVGAFLGGGVFVPFEETAFVITARARSGYDFSRETPYAGAGIHMKVLWEMRNSAGVCSLFPYVGIDAGYSWDGRDGGQALLSAGFLFDLD